MAVSKLYSGKKVFFQILLLVIPTLLIAGFFLFTANQYLNVLENQWLKQTGYFAGGIIMSVLFFSYRLDL